MLVKGHSVSAIARLLGAARSSVNRWRQRFLTDGLDGLRNGTTGRRRRLCRDKLATFLLALVETSPRDWHYQRSRWSSELMAKVIHDHARDFIHPSTIRRLLQNLASSIAAHAPRSASKRLIKNRNWQTLPRR